MALKKNSSPIPSSIPDEDEDIYSGTESDPSGAEWSGPENQLGLEPDDLFGFRRADQVVGLDEKGEINYHETILNY
jgi:hypothetical protein